MCEKINAMMAVAISAPPTHTATDSFVSFSGMIYFSACQLTRMPTSNRFLMTFPLE